MTGLLVWVLVQLVRSLNAQFWTSLLIALPVPAFKVIHPYQSIDNLDKSIKQDFMTYFVLYRPVYILLSTDQDEKLKIVYFDLDLVYHKQYRTIFIQPRLFSLLPSSFESTIWLVCNHLTCVRHKGFKSKESSKISHFTPRPFGHSKVAQSIWDEWFWDLNFTSIRYFYTYIFWDFVWFRPFHCE